jgi:putative flippase GtrA
VSMPSTLVTLFSQNRREVTRFLKFAAVGMIGALVDFTILNLAHKLFPWPNLVAGDITWSTGWPLLAANTLSFSVAVLSNFTWNRLWTFPESRARRKRQQLPQFALVNVIGLIINNAILITLQAVLRPMVGDPWDYNLAKALAIGVVLFWNFGANRFWTYRGL